jgi:hypothetical protein
MAKPATPPGQAKKPDNAAKPAKGNAVPTHILTDMPPADKHEGRIAAVEDADGNFISLVYSDGTAWQVISFAGPLAVPAPEPSAAALTTPPEGEPQAAPQPDAPPAEAPPAPPADGNNA